MFSKKKSADNYQSLEQILLAYKYLGRKRKLQLILLIILVIFASISEIIGVGALLPFMAALVSPEKIFDSALAKPIIQIFDLTNSYQLLKPLTILFIMATILSGASRLLLLWFQTYLSYVIGSDFGVRMYKNILYQSYEFHISTNSGDLIAGISRKSGDIVHHLILPSLTILSSSFILIAISVVMILIDFKITTFLFLSLSAAYFLIGYINKRYLLNYGSSVNKNANLTIRALQEGLGGIRDVILDGFQKVYVRAYENADYQLRTSQAKIQILSNCPRFIIESFGICLISLLAYFLVSTESSKDVIPLLGVLALGIQRMLPVVQLIYSSWSSIKGGQQSVDEGMKLLKESGLHNQGRPIARKSLMFNHKVELLNVSYRYSDKSRWVLNNISLTIKKGEKIGFFGESGSGKSTLLDLLMGLLSPKQGVIKVDGIELNESNRSSWQTRVAHVPQDVYLSDSTIYENIAFGLDMEAIDKNKVIDVANKAQITSTIRELSEDFKTLVGERGVRLSGGQKQRIGLARSLYKDADFLIFDEATSALDPQTEKLVMESIDDLSKDLTILMVAHRISTLKNCTILYEMKDGSIVRSGTYAELFQGKNNT